MSDYFTMEEAARYKGVCYHTVSRAVRRGVLAHQRLGRQALLARAVLDEWTPMIARRPKRSLRRTPNHDTTPTFSGEVRA